MALLFIRGNFFAYTIIYRLMKNKPKYIVVAGASAGGLNAIAELVSQLRPGMNLAVLVVLHLSRKGISEFLVHRLQQVTELNCVAAADEATIHEDHVYIAPPNYHLLVKDGRTIIGHGPTENRWRPSIDVLFRSAAAHYNGRTIGIVLTGMLDDGTSGMMAIKKSGGKCIVQDPNEAEYPDMPLSVLNNMEVDYCVRLSEMGKVLEEITSSEPVRTTIPDEVKREAEIAEKVSVGIDVVERLGEKSVYTCPDCGGSLWKLTEGKTDRYRCHIGHSYSERDLSVKQAEQTEATLWVAVRMMEERRNLLRKLETESKRKGFQRIASDHGEKAGDIEKHIDNLKKMLFSVQHTDHA
jgi:two-component system, chemotaxis family, protein-glutamate methylesterase/glutaminase